MNRPYEVWIDDRLAEKHLTFKGARKAARKLSKDKRFNNREFVIKYPMYLGRGHELQTLSKS